MRLSDLRVPEGVTLLDDPETVLATLSPPTKIEEPEPEEVEGEEGEAAEGAEAEGEAAEGGESEAEASGEEQNSEG
jgi:large subunit ribosomal protein L25